MSAQGVMRLHFIDGRVNANKYQEILEQNLLPSIDQLSDDHGEFIFQQDGATCHIAKKNKEWFAAKSITVLPWPPSSPDMSPIETIWGVMKKSLRESPANSLIELKARLQNIWNGFSAEYCKALVSTMPKRVKDLCDSKGGVAKW